MVGLKKEFANENVKFPFSCYLQVLGSDISWYCVKGTWAIVGFLFVFVWKAFLMYPVAVGGAVGGTAVWVARGRKSKRSKERMEKVLTMKTLVHDLLQGSEVGLGKDMIRDDVCNQMEPGSARRRKELMGNTWGTVLKQIKSDSRIRCAEGVDGSTGEIDELFTWVYTPRKKGRSRSSGREEEEEEVEEGGGKGRRGGRRRVVRG